MNLLLSVRKLADLEQLPDLVAFPRDVVRYHPRRVGDYRHDKPVVLGSEEVRSSSQPGLIENGRQFTVGYGILKCKNKRFLTCPKVSINANFLVNKKKIKRNAPERIFHTTQETCP